MKDGKSAKKIITTPPLHIPSKPIEDLDEGIILDESIDDIGRGNTTSPLKRGSRVSDSDKEQKLITAEKQLADLKVSIDELRDLLYNPQSAISKNN